LKYGPDPTRLVYWLLAGIFLVATGPLLFVPDEVPRSAGWLASMRPRVGVPDQARALFSALVPSLVATWALGGLYLSLGPSLAISLLHQESRVAGGLVIAVLAGSGAVASAIAYNRKPVTIVVGGSVLLILGMAITLAAVALGSVAGLYLGSLIAGLGFGPVFSGVYRSLAPLAAVDERASLLASIYVLSYLAFSLPAFMAGFGVVTWGLRSTTEAYGAAVIALAGVTTAVVVRQSPRFGADEPHRS